MAVKLISGTKVSRPELIKESKPQAGSIERQVVGPVTSALGTIPSIFQSIGDVIGLPSTRGGRPDITEKVPFTPEHQRELYAQGRGIEKESLEPQGSQEELFNMIASDLPLIALTGGASSAAKLGSSLGKSAAVNTGMKSAENLGFGPVGQLVGGLIGGKAGGDLAGKISNYYSGTKEAAKGLRPHLETVKNEAYENADKLFAGAAGDFTKTNEKLQKLLSQTYKGIPTKSKDIAQEKLLLASERIRRGTMSIADAIDLKQDFNDLAYKSDYDRKATGIFKQAARYFKDFIEEEGPKHKSAYKAYEQGEQLHKILNADVEVKNLITDYFKPSTFTTNGILKTLFKSAIGASGTLPIAETTKFLVRRPEARQYYYDVFKNIVKDNPTEAVNSLRKVVKIAEREDKQIPKEARVKVLAGKKLTA